MADFGDYIAPAAGPISLAGSNVAAAIARPSRSGVQVIIASSGPDHRCEWQKLCARTLPHQSTYALLVARGARS